MALEIVNFPSTGMVIFHSKLLVYQRVTYHNFVRFDQTNLAAGFKQKWDVIWCFSVTHHDKREDGTSEIEEAQLTTNKHWEKMTKTQGFSQGNWNTVYLAQKMGGHGCIRKDQRAGLHETSKDPQPNQS
jgi:hypothetical protein